MREPPLAQRFHFALKIVQPLVVRGVVGQQAADLGEILVLQVADATRVDRDLGANGLYRRRAVLLDRRHAPLGLFDSGTHGAELAAEPDDLKTEAKQRSNPRYPVG
jgi:hypothetical protein